MPFQDYSSTPASNTEIGDTPVFIGPNMPRDNVRPALQTLAADGRDLYDTVVAMGSGGELPGFIASGVGAVDRTALAKMRDFVSAKDFGAVGNGVTDDTTALQAALTALDAAGGGTLHFPDGVYLANNLSATSNNINLVGNGQVNIVKNANGPLLTLSGNDCSTQGLRFYGGSSSGSTLTGDNLVFTGSRARVLDCGSLWTLGRPLKMTKGGDVYGTSGAWATLDLTANGYDIELGNDVTASLYSHLVGVHTSQSTGGILEINGGSTKIIGGQIGKLYKKDVGTPIGVNGGETIGVRIVGNVTVEQSNSIWACNQFSTITITFAVGTSAHQMDVSNNLSGATVVNNGNAASPIISSIGAAGKPIFRYGGTSSLAQWQVDTTAPAFESVDGYLDAGYQKGYRARDAASGGTLRNLASITGANEVTLSYDNGGAGATRILAGTGGASIILGGTTVAQFYTGGLRPQADATYVCGTSTQQWAQFHASGGYYVGGNKVVSSRGASLPADATDLATALTLVNAIKARLKVTGGHGLVAD